MNSTISILFVGYGMFIGGVIFLHLEDHMNKIFGADTLKHSLLRGIAGLTAVFGFVFVIAGCTDLFYFSASDSKSAIVKGLILAVIIVGISQYFLTKTLDKFFPPKHIKDEKNNLDV